VILAALAATMFFFAVAYAADFITIAWHRARESCEIAKTANLSMLLEAISWTPILVAISTDEATTWACCAASVLGSRIGTARGMRNVQDPADG